MNTRFGTRLFRAKFVSVLCLSAFVLIAATATNMAQGQAVQPVFGDVGGEPTGMGSYDGATGWGDIVFHFRWHTEGYGEDTGRGEIGFNRTVLINDSALFFDASFRVDGRRRPSPSLGVGLRTLRNTAFGERILGASFWYDGNHMENDVGGNDYFQQFGVAFESLGELWDFRLNANIPFSDTQYSGNKLGVGSAYFLEHLLVQDYTQYYENALTVVELEASRKLLGRNLWGFAGTYWLDGGGESTLGGEVGLRGYFARDVLCSLAISNDKLFDTTVMFNFTWFLDGNRWGRTDMAPVCMMDRLREPVQRNDWVAIWDRWEDGAADPITNASGNNLYFMHVDSNAAAGGDGTYESPYATLASAGTASSADDYVFMHSDSTFTADSITLKNGQSLLGEGATGGHSINAYRFGQLAQITLPDRGGSVPIIQNATGDAVQLANNNVVSGLTINGGVGGITSTATTTNTTIDRVTVQDNTGYGIDLQNTSGTISIDQYTYVGGTTGAGGIRFDGFGGTATVDNTTIGGAGVGVDLQTCDGTFTFTGTTITDTTGIGFNVTGGSAYVAFTGAISQSNNAAAVAVSGNHTGTMTFTPSTSGDDVVTATGGTGLQFNAADGTYTFGKVTLNGGDAGIDVIGDSTGKFTFSDATITDPTGEGLKVVGGSADIAFTGSISQSNNVAAVDVSGNHTGTMTFTPSTSGDDVVTATGGTGLQFDAADGTYTFGKVSLNGGDAGVDIIGDSDGTFTFSQLSIIDPSGTAFNVEGGSANVAFTGNIQQSNAAAAVSISDGHDGTISFTTYADGDETDEEPEDYVVYATGGTGIQTNDADGTYTFDKVYFNGSVNAINVAGASNGTFYLYEATILDTTGTAIAVDGGTATVGLVLNETLTNAAGYAVHVQNMTEDTTEGTAGTVLIYGDIEDTGEGILLTDNTGASVTFGGSLDLDTGTNDAFTATGGGTVNFDADSTYAINTTTGTGLTLNGVTIGDDGLAIESVSVDGAANGIVMTDVTGGAISIGASGSAIGDGGTLANTTGAAVSITNVASVSLNCMSISGSGGDGVYVAHDDANTSSITINNTTIADFTGQGIELASIGAGQLTFNVTNNTLTGSTGNESVLLNIGDSAETVLMTITGNTINNEAGNSALALNVTGTGNNKTITTLIDNNTMINDSATLATMDISVAAFGTLNATVTSNTLTNGGGADECQIESSAATATVFLNLNTNVAGSGGGTFDLTNTAGTFKVYDLPDVDTNNSGTVNQTGSLTDSSTIPPTP